MEGSSKSVVGGCWYRYNRCAPNLIITFRYSHMKVVCFSDTHQRHRLVNVPDGDILIVAGDFCLDGVHPEAASFANWLKDLPHKHKVVIAGNHDHIFQQDRQLAEGEFGEGVHYLLDRTVEIEGLSIYGAPWTPPYNNTDSFIKERGEEIRQHWDLIPDDTDILITHGPPYGVLDANAEGILCGCMDLFDAALRVRPQLHVFGHIHPGHGTHNFSDGKRTTIFANVAIVGGNKMVVENEPTVIYL